MRINGGSWSWKLLTGMPIEFLLVAHNSLGDSPTDLLVSSFRNSMQVFARDVIFVSLTSKSGEGFVSVRACTTFALRHLVRWLWYDSWHVSWNLLGTRILILQSFRFVSLWRFLCLYSITSSDLRPSWHLWLEFQADLPLPHFLFVL